jgi:hypothetical protein
MKRRTFFQSLAAFGLLPTMRLPTLAPAIATSEMTFIYPWAALYARNMNACSPAMLMQRFAVSPDMAHALHARLIASGVITAPTALGVSLATQPHFASLRAGGAVVEVARNRLMTLVRNAVARLDDTPGPKEVETGDPDRI